MGTPRKHKDGENGRLLRAYREAKKRGSGQGVPRAELIFAAITDKGIRAACVKSATARH